MAEFLDITIRLIDELTEPLKKIIASLEKNAKVEDSLEKHLQKTGENIASIGENIAKVTSPLLTLGNSAMEIGEKFDSSMGTLQIASGATAKDLDLLSEKAKEMGLTTSKSAADVAEGFAYMASAGMNTEQMIIGIEPILKLSEATNMDLAKANDMATASMAAMGIEVDGLTMYLDVVAETSLSAGTEVEGIMDAYSSAGGKLKGLNIPLEESATLLGIMANAGIKGSDAGNALGEVLTNLTSPTEEAKKAFDDIGFSAFDSAGNLKGMDIMLKDLDGSVSGLTQTEQERIKTMISGKENEEALTKILDSTGKSYDTLKDKISDADGALAEISATAKNNLSGDLTNIYSKLESLAIVINDTLEPYLRKLAQVVEDVIGKIQKMNPETQAIIIKIGAFATIIGPAIGFIGKMTQNLGSIVKVFKTVSSSINIFGKIGSTMKKVGSMVTFFTSPMGLVILAIIAIAVAVFFIIKYWKPIKAFFIGIFNKVKESLGVFKEYMINCWEKIKTTFANVITMIQPHIDKIAEVINAILIGLKESFMFCFDIIKDKIMLTIDTFTTLIESIKQIFGGIIEFFAGVFTGDWSRAWEGIKEVFFGVFNGLVAWISEPINAIINVINKALGLIGSGKFQIPNFTATIVTETSEMDKPLKQLYKGTSNWSGGLVQVHERGGEIIDLPSGSRVYPHDESIQMAREEGAMFVRSENKNINNVNSSMSKNKNINNVNSSMSKNKNTNNVNFTVNIASLADTLIVREESDIEKIANLLVQKIQEADLVTL